MRASVVLLALALLSSGCATATEDDRAHYLSRVNALCADYAAKHARIGDPQTPEEVIALGPRVVAAFEPVVRGIEALEAPPELEHEAATLLELGRQQLAVLGELVVAARRRDHGALRELARRNAHLNAAGATAARRLGADTCAGG